MQPFNQNNSFTQTTPRTMIEFFRFNQSKSEAKTFTGDQNRANLDTINFS